MPPLLFAFSQALDPLAAAPPPQTDTQDDVFDDHTHAPSDEVEQASDEADRAAHVDGVVP